ncbi:rna-directed dna polymerase from mobile element jockey-like [Limosa lapponica baueri]|uniref:Rna-directed dna polymerase from mobile element jockey-like n=1 Tax=Limosa lapponica baueri TaxID=1758121 RepID=A0A2I0UQZ3_LIMLA|nr:rna-directed dna polymerase from mobile element jockey-like [Limosa lapponica baueri]
MNIISPSDMHEITFGGKLRKRGLGEWIVKWIMNWLNGRVQKIVISGAESSWRLCCHSTRPGQARKLADEELDEIQQGQV